MEGLRRRILGASSLREGSSAKAEDGGLAPVPNIIMEKHPKTRKRRNGFIFFLGGLFGIVVAGFFAGRSDLIDFPELGELSMDSLMDVLPAGLVRDARDLAVCRLAMGKGVIFGYGTTDNGIERREGGSQLRLVLRGIEPSGAGRARESPCGHGSGCHINRLGILGHDE